MLTSWRTQHHRSEVRCALWVIACFSLTSAVYLSWVYRLVALKGGSAVDWITLVLGYISQAAGLALVSRAQRAARGINRRQWFAVALLLFALLSIPTLMGDHFAGSALFGLLMNAACGVIAGLYLYGVSEADGHAHSSFIFGVGYAVATFAVGLLAVPGDGMLIRGPGMLLICLMSCLGLAVAARHSPFFDAREEAGPAAASQPGLPAKTLAMACAAVLLASMVKNLGFTFPSSDISVGLRPEYSRIPYGIGLIVAGWINDKNRKNGIICTLIALAIPFIMLSVQSEPVSRTVLWGLDYLFYSFFTVTRVILFMDIAHRTHRWELVPAGLLMGRLGDAAGTAIGMLLAGQRLALIVLTVLCFSLAVVLLFRLYQRLYEPRAVEKRSEQELFETFCLRHDLTARERDILRMLLENRTNAEITEGLFISENTVKYHVRNILQKTGCKNRIDLQRQYRLTLSSQLGEPPELKLM